MSGTFNRAAFVALWNNHAVKTQRIADAMGVTRQAVQARAKAMGLPSRGHIRLRKADPDLLREMWAAGVKTSEIAAHFGMAFPACASLAAIKLGLPRRVRGASGKRNGGWVATITLAQFFEMRLARRMAETAREEQAAAINAEMVERGFNKCLVGLHHARGGVAA